MSIRDWIESRPRGVVSVGELSRRLGVSDATIRNYARALDAPRLGSTYLIDWKVAKVMLEALRAVDRGESFVVVKAPRYDDESERFVANSEGEDGDEDLDEEDDPDDEEGLDDDEEDLDDEEDGDEEDGDTDDDRECDPAEMIRSSTRGFQSRTKSPRGSR